MSCNVWSSHICCAGDSFPLEKVHEAILESEKTGRKGKVFLAGWFGIGFATISLLQAFILGSNSVQVLQCFCMHILCLVSGFSVKTLQTLRRRWVWWLTMNRGIVSCKGFFYQRPNLKQVDRNVVPCLEGSTTVLASEASHRSDQRNHGKICSCNCNSPSSRFVNRQSHMDVCMHACLYCKPTWTISHCRPTERRLHFQPVSKAAQTCQGADFKIWSNNQLWIWIKVKQP